MYRSFVVFTTCIFFMAYFDESVDRSSPPNKHRFNPDIHCRRDCLRLTRKRLNIVNHRNRMVTGSDESQMPVVVQSVSATAMPTLRTFDPKSSLWQSYRDRIEFYLKANRIASIDDRKSIFLWSVGDTTYNLFEALILHLWKVSTIFDISWDDSFRCLC